MAYLNLDYTDPRYLCCCGSSHVIKEAHDFGIIGVISVFVQIVHAIIAPQSHDMAWFIFICFGLFAHICLVLAKGKREPMLYLPFLISGGIILALMWLAELRLIIILFIIVFLGGNVPAQVAKLDAYGVFLGIILATLVLVCAHWIYLIVLRAWEYMRRKLANPLPLIPTTVTQANVNFVPNPPPPY